jgi:hypothetical protein
MPRPRKPAEQTTSPVYRGSDGNWQARVTTGPRPDGKLDRKHIQRRTKVELQRSASLRRLSATSKDPLVDGRLRATYRIEVLWVS